MENGSKTRLFGKVRYFRISVLTDEQLVLYLVERDQRSGQPTCALLVGTYGGGTVAG